MEIEYFDIFIDNFIESLTDTKINLMAMHHKVGSCGKMVVFCEIKNSGRIYPALDCYISNQLIKREDDINSIRNALLCCKDIAIDMMDGYKRRVIYISDLIYFRDCDRADITATESS